MANSTTSENEPVEFETVFQVELAEIGKRRDEFGTGNEPEYTPFGREEHGGEKPRDFEMSDLSGVALSGGGIRSSALCLGALQAMDSLVCRVHRAGATRTKNTFLEAMDYMSTVSGGGSDRCDHRPPAIFPGKGRLAAMVRRLSGAGAPSLQNRTRRGPALSYPCRRNCDLRLGDVHAPVTPAATITCQPR